MLRVNVGLSRKLSKDYNSTGFSVNLDGEITTPPSDPEGVIEQVKELFDLAEEALSQQIDRHESTSAIASHDEQPRQPVQAQRDGIGANGANAAGEGQARKTLPPNNGNGHNGSNGSQLPKNSQPPQNGNGQEEQPATNKQVQYLLGIGKRQKLSTVQLEKKIAEILGRSVGVYDLTKQAAGVVIDALTNGASANGTRGR
jgi:hypothetical protein